MRIKFFCRWFAQEVTGNIDDLCQAAIYIDFEGREFGNYLTSGLSSDFYPNHPEHCDLVLQKIAQIESGEIEEYMWEGQGFLHYIKPDSVLFEHNIFGECPEWPLWSCSLAQYKAALLGWKKFIEMPKSIDSELIVELPDDGSSNFPHS